jgi:hypothetical protein
LLKQVVEQLQPYSTVDQDARMEGRTMSVLLSPKKEVVKVDGAAQSAKGEEAHVEG